MLNDDEQLRILDAIWSSTVTNKYGAVNRNWGIDFAVIESIVTARCADAAAQALTDAADFALAVDEDGERRASESVLWDEADEKTPTLTELVMMPNNAKRLATWLRIRAAQYRQKAPNE